MILFLILFFSTLNLFSSEDAFIFAEILTVKFMYIIRIEATDKIIMAIIEVNTVSLFEVNFIIKLKKANIKRIAPIMEIYFKIVI